MPEVDRALADPVQASEMLARAAAGSAGGWVGSAAGAGLGAHFGRVIDAMRQAGLQGVGDIVKDAMLNPERARALLAKMGGEPTKGQAISLARVYMRAALGLGDGEQRQQPASAPTPGGARAAPQPATRAERLLGTAP